jgi:hypothetical protein
MKTFLILLFALAAFPMLHAAEYFVSAAAGDDAQPGTKAAPWHSIRHALTRLQPGDTLNLRSGVYYENIYIALAGKADAPITIQSFPGEKAVLDGGWSKFQKNPETAWEPVEDSKTGEFQSVDTFPNLREVLGTFPDSTHGLQTYYHAMDLRAENELADWDNWEKREETDLKPLYLGPGLWLDRATGRIHLRLSHTHLPEPIPNYAGEADPRKVPLLLAGFDSVPLKLDGASHIRLRDLTIRNAGYTSIIMDQTEGVELDHVTVLCGTYGLRISGSRKLRLLHCDFIGNVAPWTFRSDGSKRDYPGRPHRNLARLNTHAILEIENGGESSVYATPQNDDWEIAHCSFTNAHDAVYLGSINMHFHHNRIENMQDDGLYLSPMYLRHRLDGKDPQIRIEQNFFRGVLTALAFGGTWPETRDRIFICRNVFDLRQPIQTGRPSSRTPLPSLSTGKLIGDHGSPPWPAMNIYHNTVIALEPQRDTAMATTGSMKSGNERRVYNNIFLHLARLPSLATPVPDQKLSSAGNLYWSLTTPDVAAEKFLAKSAEKSLLADPKLRQIAKETRTALDAALQDGSPAINAGVDLPAEWPDPLRQQDEGRPDIGALPFKLKFVR